MAKSKFTQADVKRALKGATAAGIVVSRFENDADGSIVIFAKGKEEG
jgi:hypothetical protein